MGAADAEAEERPVHRVYVSEYFIGRFPVTQDEYSRFVSATRYPPPIIFEPPLIASNGNDQLFRKHAKPYLWIDGGPTAGHPIVLVRYRDATATASGCRMCWDVRSDCRLKRSGRRPRAAASKVAATRGATTRSMRRAATFWRILR